MSKRNKPQRKQEARVLFQKKTVDQDFAGGDKPVLDMRKGLAGEEPDEELADAPPANLGELLVHAMLKLGIEDDRSSALAMIETYNFEFKSQRDKEQQINMLKMVAGRLASAAGIMLDKILEASAVKGTINGR